MAAGRRAPARGVALCCCFLQTALCGGLLGADIWTEGEDAPPGELAAASPGAREGGPPLLFWAVGSSPATMRLVKENVRHVRSHEGFAQASVFLVHYDMNQAAWLQNSRRWYMDHVNQSAERPGYKFQLARELLAQLGGLGGHSWVWVLDEDVDLRGADLDGLLRDARATGSQIVAPSITRPALEPRARQLDENSSQLFSYGRSGANTFCQPGDQVCKLSAPHRSCLWRYVNTVEVMTPLLRPAALQAVFECEGCMGNDSVWGLDLVWCSYVGRALMRTGEGAKACAILDRFPVVHTDARTLPKWDGQGRPRGQVIRRYFAERSAVKAHNPVDWVEPRRVATLKCAGQSSLRGGPAPDARD